jgi:hypothetical protein
MFVYLTGTETFHRMPILYIEHQEMEMVDDYAWDCHSFGYWSDSLIVLSAEDSGEEQGDPSRCPTVALPTTSPAKSEGSGRLTRVVESIGARISFITVTISLL